MQRVLAQIPETGVDELIDVTDVTAWDVLWAAVSVVIGILVAGYVRRLIRKKSSALGVPAGTVNLLAKLTSWSIIVIASVLALSFVGAEVTPFYIVLILVVIVVVVSGRTLIENYGAGVVLQTESLFNPGDVFVSGEQTGVVVEVSSRVLKLKTLDGRFVVIPNSAVLANTFEVLTKDPHRRSELIVGLAYGTDLELAREVLGAAARAAPGVLSEPEVEVFVSRFAESSIDFRIWFWHKSDLLSEYETVDQVIRQIDSACRDSGLTIAFPQRTLWWGQGDRTDRGEIAGSSDTVTSE